ncbi:FAD-dependent oxidoreductase [Salinicola halophilus]|uniref:FAD-dependent oxidoreductase n=1 Tax=Salinicola halophilus TaxID=184065 RepID=UPI000DA1CCA1|nr:FAD-dependent oxidoreductase [Salinicola halophilus]
MTAVATNVPARDDVPRSDPGLVIVGTGMAGLALARGVRARDGARPITLITADSGDEYVKPLLSSAVTKGQSVVDLRLRRAPDVAEALDARLRIHTRIDAIDPAARCLHLGAERLPYSQLVLATGATPYCPVATPPEAVDRVFQINDLDDYRRFRAALDGVGRSARIAIVGAGLVGCEYANDLQAGGYRVTLIAPEATPLARLLPARLGEALAAAFARAGIATRFSRQLVALDAAGGSVALRLDDGERSEFDFVLMATGLRPRTGLAEAAGLAVSPAGILTDRRLATSVPAIYALGDVACVGGLDDPARGVSAMYVQPLQASAKALAASLTGTPTEVAYGAWPVVVKTPLLPVVALAPQESPARWRFEGEGEDLAAIAENAASDLVGFALTGRCVRRKVELARAAPALLG